MPKISVIIPSYNHAKFVRATIDSVLSQSFQDLEVIVTDDHSTDATAQEVRAIADARVSFAELPRNCGVCVAGNASIQRSTGEYVANLSSDDLFLPGKLERQAKFLDAHADVGAVFGYPIFIDASGGELPDDATFYGSVFRVRNRPREHWLRHLFLHGNMLCSSTALVRRSCYDDIGLLNPALAQVPDLEIWVRLLKRYQIHVIEEPVAAFRILDEEKNASAPRPEGTVRLHWELRKVLEQYLDLERTEFAKVFPEFAAYVLRAPKSGWFAAFARRILERYLGRRDKLPDARNTQSSTTPDQPLPVAWCLAQIALEVGRPAHVLFALDAMYGVLGEMGDNARYREFIKLTGSYDPFGVLSKLPTNRALNARRD
jgi:glycosyltransferase involved in cell wall biosynthesis